MKSSKAQEEFLKIAKNLRENIRRNGFVIKDERLGRKTKCLSGRVVTIENGPLLKWIKESHTDWSLYDGDYSRMRDSLTLAIELAKKDPGSRRLAVFNTDNYSTVHPCFTVLHFVYTGKDYQLLVDQRASDLVKLLDDITFFGEIARLFEEGTGKKVSKLILFMHHVHYQL